MKKQITLLLAVVLLTLANTSMALTINAGTVNVGDLDSLMAYTTSGDSGIATENAWASQEVLNQDGIIVTFGSKTGSTSTDWVETNQAGVYAFYLSGEQDYYIVKTGNLYIGNPSERPALTDRYDTFLYRNNVVDSWAVINLSTLIGDNDPVTYMASFSVNTGKISHVTTPGDIPPVPEPSTIVLLGCGLVGLAFYGRKRIKA